MASSDIQKLAVFDARVAQPTPKYAIQKGSLALTNSPYNAIAATSSQMTFNVNAPSQNVFVARDIDWRCDGVVLTWRVTVTGGTAGQPIFAYGDDFALAPYPLHQMVQTLQTTINDTNTVINLADVIDPVLRLTDYDRNRLVKTSPCYLDTYARYDESKLAINDPLGGYQNATVVENQPNGAWAEWSFVNPVSTGFPSFGTPGSGSTTTYQDPNIAGAPGLIQVINGIPCLPASYASPASFTIGIRFKSTERLMLPPFIFNDEYEGSVGLFGINNIQFVMNMKANLDRIIRYRTDGGSAGTRAVVAGSVQLPASNPFGSATLQVQYLTPSLDMPLPSKSVVPYLEFPRYIKADFSQAIGANSSDSTVQSQTIVLPQIPDMLVIYAKPVEINGVSSVNDGKFGDINLPITQISINFDNVAGLLSSHTEEELYRMCVNNGLHMPYDQWKGRAYVGGSSPGVKQSSGGFLVLRPGKDFALATGQAPGLLGNYVLQFTCKIENPGSQSAKPALYVMTVNSGFFETMAGSSRIVKGVLSEADILNAPAVADDMSLNRMVGSGFFDKLGSFLTKAKDIYSATKPFVSQVKGMLPETGTLGKVKGALGAVGYGMAGAGMAGAGLAGAGKRKSISARLM